ncbi:hypothetical protein ACJ3XI_06365 [Litorimonas sp. RW-G-Af-16]|uniref:hypothetical protein n=1 Tax=Litorimonas sp. RW-G-Af-16 TaxID=3241168 RepID=UPI00390C7992
MVYQTTSSTRQSSRIVPATLALIFAALMSFVSLNISGSTIALTWLPLLLITLWPRQVPSVYSIALFLAVGLFVDWGSAGAPGQWAIIYLAVFAVLRPDRRAKPIGFVQAVQYWVVALITGLVLLVVTGWFVYGVLPNTLSLARQVGLVTVLLPIVFALRGGLRYILTDADDRDF